MSRTQAEIQEIEFSLRQPKEIKRKPAIKHVISLMTAGRDVSALFSPLLSCLNTKDIEIKKLIYLYLMHYAKSKPSLVEQALQFIVVDVNDQNPLVRALALRTMASIRVEKFTTFLIEPLKEGLKDKDPYVRKTAVLAVAKLFDINPELVKKHGFVDRLTKLLSDSNSMVVSNTVATLMEISNASPEPVFQVTKENEKYITSAINESTEWGQVFLLESLMEYQPPSPKEAEKIIDRVVPRLSHKNSAVVLSSVRLILKMFTFIEEKEIILQFARKMAPSLVSLMDNNPEVQYVALRNINLFVQRFPKLLIKDAKVFFCKYKDPVYIKMEKVDILVMLATNSNINELLIEFTEYAKEVDVDFVRKSVNAIGKCAIKLSKAAQACVKVLIELVKTKINYIVQEVIIVVRDIFRRYPNQYESIIGVLCENLQSLDQPEAKASMVWIIGEYSDRIDNADELLKAFLFNFHEEDPEVQLQLLTSSVKLFLSKPDEGQEILEQVLSTATNESDNPDLRDRAFMYFRLVDAGFEEANNIILGEKPLIDTISFKYDSKLLGKLLSQISTLSSVFHKLPETFISGAKVFAQEDDDNSNDEDDGGILQVQEKEKEKKIEREKKNEMETQQIGQLINFADSQPPPIVKTKSIPQQRNDSPDQEMFEMEIAQRNDEVIVDKEEIIDEERGKGMIVSAAFRRREQQIYFDLTISNRTSYPFGKLAMVFNKNLFGMKPNAQVPITGIMPGQTTECSVVCPIIQSHKLPANEATLEVQIAIKNFEVFYTQCTSPMNIFFTEDGKIEKRNFLNHWKAISDDDERIKEIQGLSETNPDILKMKLANLNIFFIAKRQEGSIDILYFSLKLVNSVIFLIELSIDQENQSCQLATRSQDTSLIPLFEEFMERFLTD
ncbi:beta-adaptin-like protein b [Anaeramoeba ignava]|uniref:AP complex subunit beta n=1 Tax=Anaeramoeba ignava TaxID=1746090 RepID=A0A9Q0LQL1_ANAIG|nr:beta-adaptin-like protein b [Anaeramoeba ignava]